MLVRFALRVCAVEALKGRTLVGENVRNSRIGAIDIAADQSLRIDEDRPFVDIFSDESESSDAELRDLRQNGALRLNFESGIASAMTQTDPETKISVIVGVGIPATDDALELTLDLIDRQVVTALTDPDNEWAELWRKLSDGVTKIERRRISSNDVGTRRAARQLSLTLMAKPDPVWGQTLTETSVWKRFRDKVSSDRPDLLSTLDMMLGPTDGETSIDTIRRSLGHTDAESRTLGYAPASPGAPDATVQMPIVERDTDGAA